MIRSTVIGSLAFLILALVGGCVDSQETPTVVYKGEFDNSKIDSVESIVNEVAQRWKLRTFRKDREQMKRLTSGQDAFFVALYFEKDPVLVLSNVGVGTVLTMSTTDCGRLPVHVLNGAANDLIETLRNRLSIELQVLAET